jgi:hypothetical protein
MEIYATAHDTNYTSFCNISHYTTDGLQKLHDPKKSIGIRRIDFNYSGTIARKFEYGSGSVLFAVGT